MCVYVSIRGKDPVKGINGRFVTDQRVIHDSKGSKIRFLPQDDNIIAATSSSGSVLVYNLREHEKSPYDHIPHPQHTFTLQNPTISDESTRSNGSNGSTGSTGSTGSNVTSVSWSFSERASLAACCEGHVCVFDLSDSPSASPLLDSTEQKGVLHDVQWHPFDGNELAACGANSYVFFYDRRKPGARLQLQAHKRAVHRIAFNPIERFLFATASADATVALWDSRNTTRPLHSLFGHGAAVRCLEWSPFNAGVLASGGEDERVCIWDLNRVGSQPLEELVFVHGGHTAPISEIAWNPNVREWVLGYL